MVLPELIVPELRRHLDTFAAAGPDGCVFVGLKGGQLRRSNFSKPWARELGPGYRLRSTSMIFAMPETR